jgi:hypothetical protein
MVEEYRLTGDEIGNIFEMSRFYDRISEYEKRVRKDGELFEGLRGCVEQETARKVLEELPSEEAIGEICSSLRKYGLREKAEEIGASYLYITSIANES